VASIVVLAGVFLLAALFLLGTVNLMAVVRDLQGRMDMIVLLREGVPVERARGLATIIGKLEGVEEVRYVSAEEVLADLGADPADRRALLDMLGDEPFPASLELRLVEDHRTPDRLERLSRDVEAIPGVEAAHYGREWVEPLARVVRIVLVIDGIVGGVVGLVCAVVAWGAGRLAVYGREDVVGLMRLAGARWWHLVSPFAVEGAVCGFVGGLSAVGLLYVAYRGFAPHVAGFHFLPTAAVLGVPLVGLLLGLLGSLAAVRR
jgi:cell division transport system permease protein